MDPYQQQQQQLMAAFNMGLNRYPPPPPNGNMTGMNMNTMTLTTPLMESVFGHPHPHSQPQPHPGAPGAAQAPMSLPPVRRAPSSMTVRAPKGMHRPQPKPGHTAKKNDGKSTGPWSHNEHQQFEKAVIIYGWGNWVQVRIKIPGRTKDQCKSHAQKFAKHHPAEKARLDREHEAYVELQLQQRNALRGKTAKTAKRIVHSSNTQMETLPGFSGKSFTPPATNDDDAAKGGDKSKSSPSPKSSPPAKKKVSVKAKLPAKTTGHTMSPWAIVEGNQATREENEQHDDAEKLQSKGEEEEIETLARPQKPEQRSSIATKDNAIYEESLPVVNTITPPTKSRETTVSRASNPTDEADQRREARELLAMSNTMNMEAKAQQPRQEQHQNESPKVKDVQVSVDDPPVVHTPSDFDPESIDTICAEIYNRKQENGCKNFPLCLCGQTPCAKKSRSSSYRVKKGSIQGSL